MLRAASIAASLLIAGTAGAQAPGFWLTGKAPDSQGGRAAALTQDGGMAAGYSNATTPQAPFYTPGFTWTRKSGRYDFGLEPGLPQATPVAGMSSDGHVLVGRMLNDTQTPIRAYRRVGSGPLQDLGVLPGEDRSYAWGVSGDGGVVVGHAERSPQGNAFGQAFRWSESDGMQGLGYLRPNGSMSKAHGISRDASTIVGMSQSNGIFGDVEAFKWTAVGGMQALPTLPGAPFVSDYAQAVSSNGDFVVGVSAAPNGRSRAVRWTSAGVEDLGVLPDTTRSYGYAISDDGSVVGGTSYTGSFHLAFVWTPTTAMLPLSTFLSDHGLTVPADYRLEYVYAISGDGLTFAGEASNFATGVREGFVATIPSAGTMAVPLAPCFLRRRRG